MIVVMGASGVAGRPAIDELVKRRVKLRVLTSSKESAEKLLARGVDETVIGDFRNPVDIRNVIAGASQVLFIPPSMVEDQAEIGKAVVREIRDSSVSHLVFLSCVHPQVRALAHHWHKLEIEEAIIQAGVDYTILQPSMFMQNLNNVWHHVVREGALRWPWDPGRRISFVDTDDLAEVIAISLTTERLHNGTFEICSASTITMDQTAEILSQECGKPVRAEKQSAYAFRAQAQAIGLSEWRINNMLAMSAYYDAHGYSGGNPLVATAVLGRDPRDYRAFVRKFMADKTTA